MQLKDLVQNPAEYSIYRNENGFVWTAGSLNINNTLGQESISLDSTHGDDLTFAPQAASLFNPNNWQHKTNGDSTREVMGYNSEYTGRDRYINTVGSLNITCGSPRLFDRNDSLTSDYLNIRAEIAAAGSQPAINTGGYTNNTKSKIPLGGSPDFESGSTDGMSFSPNTGYTGYKSLVKSKIPQLTRLESQMGVGGDVKIEAGKHVFISAGTKAVAFDSGYVNPKGRKIQYKNVLENDEIVAKYSAVPTYQEKDTSSTMPWGNMTFLGTNKITFSSGAGGVEIGGLGNMKLVGTGLTWIGGAQVDIKSEGSVYINGVFIETSSDYFNVDSDEVLFLGNVNIDKDVVIKGNLTVGGSLQVLKDINCKGNLNVEKTITAKEDVIVDEISFLDHKHEYLKADDAVTPAYTEVADVP